MVLGPLAEPHYRPGGPDSLLEVHPKDEAQVKRTAARIKYLLGNESAWRAALAWKHDQALP